MEWAIYLMGFVSSLVLIGVSVTLRDITMSSKRNAKELEDSTDYAEWLQSLNDISKKKNSNVNM